ncbi:MAG: RNA polymerase sigma-70 factor [Chitinophagaceae bacterium]|jgi:RNA polymerase sigma-70 factor (ECF subfamily)
MSSLTALDEKDLLQRLSAGDETAFATLYNQYKGLLYIHAYRKLQNREEAKDIIQEIFVSIWEKRKSLEITTGLSAYLYQAVRFKVIDRIARKQTASAYMDHFQAFLDTYSAGTDHMARERILSSIIDKEIGQLPPKMRQVFELSRKQYLSHKEIAEQLNITEQSVRSHIKNALKILKPKLGIFILVALLLYR